MKVTVGIPARNGEQYLEEAISSAVGQNRPAEEILLLDHGSTDRTAEIAKSSRWNGRVHYAFSSEGSGFADAFNQLVRLAGGDFVSILCADDALDEDCLKCLEEGKQRFPTARLVYGGCRYVSEGGELLGTSPPPHGSAARLIGGRQYAHEYLMGVWNDSPVHRCAAFIVERDLALKRQFRRDAGLIADTDFFVRIGEVTDVVAIGRPMATIRCHPESVSAQVDSMALRLAEDYLFQVKTARSQVPAGGPATTRIYQDLAARFLDALFMESIRRGRPTLLRQALELKATFEELVPEYWTGRRRRLREVAWQAALSRRGTNAGLRAMVACVGALREFEKAIRKVSGAAKGGAAWLTRRESLSRAGADRGEPNSSGR